MVRFGTKGPIWRQGEILASLEDKKRDINHDWERVELVGLDAII